MYDYGMGGVWGIAKAESADDIAAVLPELKVIEKRPEWLDEARIARLHERSKFEVGDETTYPEWLQILIRNRSRET
jgi:hypothetical protein